MSNLIRDIWKRVFDVWMRFAHVLGVINTTILLTLVYIVMVLPLKLGFLLLRKDPLRLRSFRRGPTWQVRDTEASDLDERSHPF